MIRSIDIFRFIFSSIKISIFFDWVNKCDGYRGIFEPFPALFGLLVENKYKERHIE